MLGLVVVLFIITTLLACAVVARAAHKRGELAGAEIFLDDCAAEFICGRDGFEIFNRQINERAARLPRLAASRRALRDGRRG